MNVDYSVADRISDRVIDAINAENADPRMLLAGVLLGLIGFMRTAPAPVPASFAQLGVAATTCLTDITNSLDA